MDMSEEVLNQHHPSSAAAAEGNSLEYLSNSALLIRHNQQQQQQPQAATTTQQQVSKYAQLLNVLEEMGKDIRPTYAGSKSSGERLKRSIVHARILVRECLMETERSARQ